MKPLANRNSKSQCFVVNLSVSSYYGTVKLRFVDFDIFPTLDLRGCILCVVVVIRKIHNMPQYASA